MSAVRRPLAVRVLIGLVLVIGLVFSVTTIPGVRPRPGFWVPVDGWLQGTGYALMAVLIVLRPLLVARDRVLWGLFAAAITARSLGFLLFFAVVRLQVPMPYPSASDGFWIASAVLFLVALTARARHGRVPALSRLLALDGLAGGLAAAGLSLAVVYPVLVSAAGSGAPLSALTLNLAYPVLDVVSFVLVTALVAAGCRASRGDLLLLAGIVLSSAVDVTYLLLLAEGLWRPGTPVSALLYVATALVCLAPWASTADLQPRSTPLTADGGEVPMTRSITEPGITWTAILAIVCLVGVVVVELVDGSLLSLGLLTAGVVAAIVRGLLTLREDQQETDAMLGFSAQERERFAALVEASDDFIAIATLDGQLLYLNPAGRDLTGIAQDADVRGMGYEAFRPDDVLEQSRSVAMPRLRASGHFESRTWLRHQQGGPSVPVLSHSFVMRSPRTGAAFALGSIQRDVTEISEAQQQLQHLADERQQLLTRLVQVQDDERARIAADVHDDSVQALAAVQLRLGLLERQLGGLLDDDQRASLGTVQETVAGATARLRHLLFDLESPARRTDLVTALEEAASYVLEEVGVSWTVEGSRSVDLPEATRVTAYRVAKEALVNVRKHAGAEHVQVEVHTDETGVTVCVRDDGLGITEGHDESRPGHLGLASMRDRATVAGGRLDVEAHVSGGTLVRLWLPGPAGEDARGSGGEVPSA